MPINTVLQEEPEFDVVGEAVDVRGLIGLSEKYDPDPVLMEKELPVCCIEKRINERRIRLEPKNRFHPQHSVKRFKMLA